ncbi:helix-turn-helix domain-containing protein [Flavobacterium aquidurense]|uniref:helix-turn-helix domain-containing protein n=1 Tax=Flavobacterium aquidurense TaxID=362413 RepID=UPI003756C53D
MNNLNVSYRKYYDIEIFEGKLSSHKYDWHFHQSYTIVFVEKGSLTYLFKESKIVLQRQQILIINPFEIHCNITSIDCEYKVVFMPGKYFPENSSEKCILYFKNRISYSSSLFEGLKNKVLKLENSGTVEQSKSAAKKTAHFLSENFNWEMRKLVVDTRILKAVNHIDENLSGKLTINELSQISCLSRFYFQRLFKKHMGLTVNDYIQVKRTELAKSLLRQKNKVASTVYDTGYFDQSHFNKAFKKMWVVNPSHFLEK